MTTDLFAPLGQRIARGLGMDDLVIVHTPHPVSFLTEPELAERAEEIVDEVIYGLTQPAEKLAREYKDRYAKKELPRSSIPM